MVLVVKRFQHRVLHVCNTTDKRCVVPEPLRIDPVVVLHVQLDDGAEVLGVVPEEPLFVALHRVRDGFFKLIEALVLALDGLPARW